MGNGKARQSNPGKLRARAGKKGHPKRSVTNNLHLPLEQNPLTQLLITTMDGRTILYASPAIVDIIGPNAEAIITNPGGWLKTIHPEDLNRVLESHAVCAAGAAPRYIFRIVRTDGQVRWMECDGYPTRDDQGAIAGVINLLCDVTDREETRLQLEEDLAVKDTLLREVRHRTKNSFQMLSSLLRMQKRAMPEAASILDDSCLRMEAMAMIHDQLYASGSADQADLGHFVTRLCGHIFRAGINDSIRPNIRIDNVFLRHKTLLPCGLILNELVTNAYKHAFPGGRKGELNVHGRESGGKVTLVVRDNGIGLPPGFDLDASPSLGIKIVRQLIRQLHGSIGICGCKGTTVQIEFPLETETSRKRHNMEEVGGGGLRSGKSRVVR
jgi:PAS domain S-box-containing protein